MNKDTKLQYEELAIRFEEQTEKDVVPFRLSSPTDRLQLQGFFRIPFTPEQIDRALASINRFSKGLVQRSAERETLDPIKEIGDQLFTALFQGSIGEAYTTVSRREGIPWRLRLTIHDSALAALPWEFLYDRRDFIGLSAQASVVRQWAEAPFKEKPMLDPVRVLFIAAGFGELRPGIEKEIEAVQNVANKDRMKLTIVRDATPERFLAKLQKGAYEVVIFSGTAKVDPDQPWDDSQALVLMGESGQRSTMRKDQLVEALRTQESLRLVYLSACDTDRLAGALSKVAPATVGMRGDVTEDACIVFTGRLLGAALDGLWLDEAVAHARRAVDMNQPGDRGWGMPVFHLSTPEGVGVRICEPRPQAEVVTPPSLENIIGNVPPQPDPDGLHTLLVAGQQNLNDLQKQIDTFNTDKIPEYVREQYDAVKSKTDKLKKAIASKPPNK